MYFLKNEVNGAECLCSSTYDPTIPSQKYSIDTDRYEPFRATSAKQPSAYTKQPSAYAKQPSAYAKQPAAGTCQLSTSPMPASARRSSRSMTAGNHGVIVPSRAMMPRSRHRGFYRPAMTMEPVSKVKAVYEDTESSRPFDFEVDYGNAYAGYTDNNDYTPPTFSQTQFPDDIFFNFNNVDQTSPQYLEALRLFYDKLGFPNFSPKNGYESPVELFQPQPKQMTYGKISKF